ncbi:MAG TPA: toll/interleukin-1 receptor domain-containing protein [Acidobacteriota bacterium]|nr:toll/interleukin-1 receptor domain-containing protein [Acidobacteriota bacterium]
MLYDVFVCHASEDKDGFVRDLARELSTNNVAVWYDEFSLKPGDSLRESIDSGLSQSRFGVVVLSAAFFQKSWPQWELNGLVQRQTSSDTRLIIPVWLNVDDRDVRAFSPSLADVYAIHARQGVSSVVGRLLAVIKPQGSSLVVARDRLLELGYSPPVVTDDWWHRAIEYCGSNPMEGTFQEAMGWGRWGFPLPPPGTSASERGFRIARAAMQVQWQAQVEDQRISQVTHPDNVHEFIASTPGLMEICFDHPQYLACYAPQLTIPGFGGPFESIFDMALEASREDYSSRRADGSRYGSSLTTDGSVPTCDELIALRDPEFGHFEPGAIACCFVTGPGMNSPPVQAYEHIEYIAWLLSESSSWVPAPLRECLTTGMRDWAVWVWHRLWSESGQHVGALFSAMADCSDPRRFKMSRTASADLRDHLGRAKSSLRLPESVTELARRFRSRGFIEAWILKQSTVSHKEGRSE